MHLDASKPLSDVFAAAGMCEEDSNGAYVGELECETVQGLIDRSEGDIDLLAYDETIRTYHAMRNMKSELKEQDRKLRLQAELIKELSARVSEHEDTMVNAVKMLNNANGKRRRC